MVRTHPEHPVPREVVFLHVLLGWEPSNSSETELDKCYNIREINTTIYQSSLSPFLIRVIVSNSSLDSVATKVEGVHLISIAFI